MCPEADAEVVPIILELRDQGLSLRAMGAELTGAGIKTRQEYRTWHARQVARILARAAAVAASPLTPPEFAGHEQLPAGVTAGRGGPAVERVASRATV